MQDENIEDWEIRRTVDGKERDPYKLDSRFKAVRPGAKITVNSAQKFFAACVLLILPLFVYIYIRLLCR